MHITSKNETFGIFSRQNIGCFLHQQIQHLSFHPIAILTSLIILMSNSPAFSQQYPMALFEKQPTAKNLSLSESGSDKQLNSPKNGTTKDWRPTKSTALETKAKNQAQVQVITLKNNASLQEIGELLIEFRKAGIQLSNKINKKRKLNWIKHFNVHFQHAEGLNFKLKITGFQKLEFQLVHDEQKQFQYFTYRINEEEVYNLIELDTKGFKSYVCYDTGVVVRGETNEDIVRVY